MNTGEDLYNPENTIEAPLQWVSVIIDKGLLNSPKPEKYKAIQAVLKDEGRVGKMFSDIFSGRPKEYRYRCFWRRTDKKGGEEIPTESSFPNSTYSESVRLIHEKGIEKDIQNPHDDGLWASLSEPLINFLIPTNVSPTNARSFILIYGRDPARQERIKSLIRESRETQMSSDEYQERIDGVNNDFIWSSPRDALTRGGVIEIEWK